MAPFTSRDKKKAKRDPSPGSREAGEVIPIVPPGESSKTKKTSPGSPEAGELIPIVPPGESSKTKKTKSGPKTTIDERDERKRENAIIRHAWFKWFTSQANLTPMRKLYWTPGADEGRKRFENKLVELGTEAFAHLSLDPNAPLFSHYTLDVQTRLRKYVTQVLFQWTQELETWLASDQFHSWTNERPAWVFPSTLREPRYLDPIKERARVWQEWFKKPRELSNCNSLSFKYKECEPMSDNKIRWINFNTWLTPMVSRTRLGAWLYVNHPTVVRPVAAFSDPKTPGLLFPWWNGTAIKKWYQIERTLRGKVTLDGKTRQVSEDIGKYDRDHQLNATIFRRHRLQIAGTLLQGLAFMHGRDWLHCDIHYGNIFVHFPLWDWDDKQAHNKRHDNLETDGDRINHKLVFVGIGDLGYAQTTQDAAAGKRRYNHLDKICGDFFIDMSREEKLEYDREKWAMGYPTTSEPPHQTHRLRLKEALDAMVYLNISSLRDHRKTAEYWAHYFIDQLMVDPTICMRPIESTKRAAKHPDGPRDIKENKW
ncbi:hypothetical protein R1sor_011538 [Riccia sorocarpa]|uniref:Protein kinase domain-containing protein n=1 Tax=Riccia sorocarpa TaxID=122646 RepID=A0ABD3I3W7_9MARC